MPSSVLHNYFSIDVYNKLNNKIKNIINPCLSEYKVFSQGPDPYFFYDFHLTKRSKKVFEINYSMQHININKHFSCLINYINDNNFYSNSMVMAYLYGQICHFALDSTCHPYIIYNTGMYNSKDKNTYKYNGLHEEMEYYLDCYYIYKREKIMPKNYKAYNELFSKINFNNELNNTLDKVIHDVYGYDNASKLYLKSLKDMKKFYHIFNYDKTGIKKFIYSIMDSIFKNKVVKKRELSFNIDSLAKLYYLNLDRNIWHHPCDNEEFNYSFGDLYNIALKKALFIISAIDKMLNSKNIDNQKICSLFNNLDYGTGKDCDKKYPYKYFKF